MQLCSTGGAKEPTSAKRPNVIILLSDDQGYGDLSCHGNPILKTPNLDRLHSESVRLTDFHVAPMCTPTRGQLMSGMDALRNGATSVTAGRALMRPGIPTMPEIFATGSYRTGIFGKWHLGDNYPNRPMDRGFQDAIYHLGFGLVSAPEFTNNYFDGTYRHNGAPRKFKGYCTDFWFTQAIKWMGERHKKGEPFFCYLPLNAPHGPLLCPAEYEKLYAGRVPPNVAKFYGMIANIDDNFSRLEAFLKETGLRDNTILIFMTDNGGTAGVKTFNAGMRGGKTTYYEGGHRVPCFVRWPAGQLRAPGDVQAPTQIQDLLPTLIELCGLPKPANASFDGTSLAGLLRGKADALPDRMLVVQYGQIPKKWDSCVIWNQWRLVHGKELYDIKTDHGQAKDVAAQHPDVAARMRAHYEEWWSRVESRLDEFVPISIGSDKENPVALTSSDWQNIYADNPGHVRSGVGGPRGGPWAIKVERDGEYKIELRRWPREADTALGGEPKIPAVNPSERAMGLKSFPIAQAHLSIAGQELTAKVSPGAKAAIFKVKLHSTPKTLLQGWFSDAEGKDLCGAYYAYVRKL
jgi:arylsulfatase